MASFLTDLFNQAQSTAQKFVGTTYSPNLVRNAFMIPNIVKPVNAQTAPSNAANAPGDPNAFANLGNFINSLPGNQSAISGGGNIPSSATTGSQNTTNQGISNIQSAQNNGNSQIEADYNQSMGMLDNAQGGLQSQAGAASAQIDTGAGAATNEINNTQATATGAANTSLQTAEKQGTGALQQARDLFRQTQQSNNAQMSALGISSSSVSEALAERLGVETARRIAGVTGSIQEVRQNTVNELGRIKTYYQGQIQNLTQHVADQKAQIHNSLMQGLNQINSARSQAASDKSAARSSLLQQSQNAISQLSMQQQQFQQSLDQWAAQKSAALTPIVQDPNYLNNLISTAQTLNAQPQFSQFGTAVPNVNVNAQGTMTGQIGFQKTPIDPNTGLPVIPQANQTNSSGGLF